MTNQRKKISEESIGSPQVIARQIEIEGLSLLVRLQKPLEEPPLDDAGNEIKCHEDIRYPLGCALILEVWSEATQSIITLGMQRNNNQTEEEFSAGVRYLMNNCSDKDIIDVLTAKGLMRTLKYQVSYKSDKGLVLPKPPKKAKEK